MNIKYINLLLKTNSLLRLLVIVGFILLLALFGNIFIDGWSWGIFDFVFAGIMFFSAGLVFDLVLRKVKNRIYKISILIAVVALFLLIWVEMAVDAVSRFISLIF